MRLTDESIYEKVHKGLHTVELVGVAKASGSRTGSRKLVGSPLDDLNRETQVQGFNRKVWQPWWTSYLQKCEEFI